jgi:hypothetical protein
MSTASPHIVSSTHARAEGFGARWERLLAVASVCLPIPLLAATGLSIPLPSSVERIGAALVAWADDDAGAGPLPVSGDIVLVASTQAAPELREEIPVAARATAAQAIAAPAGGSTSESRPKSGGGGNDGSGGSTDSGGSSPPTSGGGNSPPAQQQPGLVEGTVNNVTKTTEPVVDIVEDTVGGLGETVDGLLPTEDLLGGGGLLGSGGLHGSGK